MKGEPAPRRVAADLLAGFPGALREAGLPIDPGRATAFLRAATLCRLDGIHDLARAGRVTLTGSPDDFATYDAVFEAWFSREPSTLVMPSEHEEESPQPRPPRGGQPPPEVLEGDAAGKAASDDAIRAKKAFGTVSDPDAAALARLKRRIDDLPALRSRSWRAASHGPRIDLAATYRAARSTFGETLRILRRSRPDRPRKLLLLIDVSGSMKAQSETYLRFAQLVTRSRRRVETFVFGTSLTRVTRTLSHRDPDEALAKLSSLVFDFDGGTRIGASLEEFLSVSRHAALVRGAVTIILSDGLERGDPATMINSVARMARLSHRLVWGTPLAADPRYRPLTRAMAGSLPHLDGLFDASGLPALERILWRLDSVERAPRGHASRRFDLSASDLGRNAA